MSNLWDENHRIVEAFDEVYNRIENTIPYKDKWYLCNRPENAIVNDSDIPDKGRQLYKSCDASNQRVIIIPTEYGNVVLHEKAHDMLDKAVVVSAPYALTLTNLVPLAVIAYAGDIKRLCGEGNRSNIGQTVDALTEIILENNESATKRDRSKRPFGLFSV